MHTFVSALMDNLPQKKKFYLSFYSCQQLKGIWYKKMRQLSMPVQQSQFKQLLWWMPTPCLCLCLSAFRKSASHFYIPIVMKRQNDVNSPLPEEVLSGFVLNKQRLNCTNSTTNKLTTFPNTDTGILVLSLYYLCGDLHRYSSFIVVGTSQCPHFDRRMSIVLHSM